MLMPAPPIFAANVSVIRPQDLCVLELRFVNLRSDDGVTLVKEDAGAPSFVVVELPPQHIAETLIPYAEPLPELPSLPLSAHIAGPTRLVFLVEEAGNITYLLESILQGISSMPLSVQPNAQPPAPPTPWAPPTPTGSGFEALLEVSQSTQAQRVAEAETGGAAPVPITDARPTTPLVEPAHHETAIEFPVRLILSPHVGSGFAHPPIPHIPQGATRVELWNTRLGVRVGEPGAWRIDERSGGTNTVRAVWTPDLHSPPEIPFATLPSAEHRTWLVQQTADFSLASPPIPIEVNRMVLTALGGNVDALVSFPTLDPENPPPLQAWRQITTLGRDQYVCVVTSGWLSLGHEASLIEVVERQFLATPGSDARVAALVKRTFLVVRQPFLDYEEGPAEEYGWARRQFPFKTIRIVTTTTPPLSNPSLGDPFSPEVDGQPFYFSCIGTDIAGNILEFEAKLFFFPYSEEGYGYPQTPSRARLTPHNFAVAPPSRPGNTTVTVSEIAFGLEWDAPYLRSGAPFAPTIAFMRASIPSLAQSTGQSDVRPFAYPWVFIAWGFAQESNPQEVFLGILDEDPDTKTPVSAIHVDFSRQSARSGAFITPNLVINGLSRICGPHVSPPVDPNNIHVDVPAARTIDPAQYFAGLDAKLLGVFRLTDIIKPLSDIVDAAPSFVTETFNELGSFFALLARIEAASQRLDQQISNAGAQGSMVAVALEQLQQRLDDILQAGIEQLQPATVVGFVAAARALEQALEAERAATNPLGIAQAVLQETSALLREVLGFIGDVQTLIDRLRAAQQAMQGAKSLTTVLEWRPPLQIPDWLAPILVVGGPLLLRAEIRGRQVGAKPPGVDILASLENFEVRLTKDFELVRMRFERLQFSVAAGKKPDVDCVFHGIEFLGPLKFLEILSRLIPLDGFSDPPNIHVDESGITAGLSLAIPAVGLGVFSLENIAFSAGLLLPFVGGSPQLRFDFCSRENPFMLAIAFLGGGGWFGLTASTDGLEMFECSLEFGAVLSINLGVASGGVSLTAGIYLRVEQGNTRLSGFVRLRGHVSVLGIASISLEVRLTLGYDSGKNRAYGRADIILEVSILFFSISVKASCEKSFSQTNSDPTFAQVMGPEGNYAPWDEYCAAFA
jgi:hypothetical protein